ncbi:tyrosine-type recombinase/integrase [Candidatus Woesearchaeota archaeon]|nr:tyrosine-type recombinase/integrase [Candidatus Woesearchaeota archaeon]
MEEIHNYKNRIKQVIERILREDMCEENKELILRFKDNCIIQGISTSKTDRYLQDCIKLSRMLKKKFSGATKDDITKIMVQLEQTDLSFETKRGFKIMIRKLFKFIRGTAGKEYPDEVKWISIGGKANHTKLPEELLTEKEIELIIKHANNIRDKALISCLAESGCRIAEIGNMKIKQVSFEEHGARLTVSGKTGARKILVIASAPYLQQWINQHPFNENPDNFLWIGSTNNLICYARILAIIKKYAHLAGIKKRIYPHLFRHSRATFLASMMSDASLKQYFGWAQGSKMASIYIHMSGKDTDDAILKVNGIEAVKEKKQQLLIPKKCLRCFAVNEATNRFCKVCGFSLNKEEAEIILKADVERKQADDIMNRLMKDNEILELIRQKLTQNVI